MVDIHNSLKRFEAARRRVASLDNAELLLAFLDHLEALGLSKIRMAKYASALCTILKNVEFDPKAATKSDVERVVAWINRQPFKEWTKHDLKLALRKLIQFAKNGSCDRRTPVPDEAAWIPLTASEKDSRVRPEKPLTPDEVKAMIRAAENERDKALISILYEAALRPRGLCELAELFLEDPRQLFTVFDGHWKFYRKFEGDAQILYAEKQTMGKPVKARIGPYDKFKKMLELLKVKVLLVVEEKPVKSTVQKVAIPEGERGKSHKKLRPQRLLRLQQLSQLRAN